MSNIKASIKEEHDIMKNINKEKRGFLEIKNNNQN